MAKLFHAICVLSFVCQLWAVPAKADQWASVVLTHCYNLDDRFYQRHFFVRVFRTPVGGGQLYRSGQHTEGPLYLRNLSNLPVSCMIDDKEVRLELVDYREPTPRGAAGLADHTGFRLLIDDRTIWEVARPERLGDPIFNGTIDVDRRWARICTEKPPDALGIVLPYEPDYLQSRTSILVCETVSY